jgi:hypothetical protein
MLETILKDEEIQAIINNVNNIIIVNNCGCHGIGHITRVMNYVETILKGINCDEHTIELGKIAAYLHDIGAIMGKQGHAERSADFILTYLKKLNMPDEDIKQIEYAIRNHSKGLETKIGAALTFADKIDMQKSRMMRFKENNYFHDNIKHMLDIKLTVDNENIIVNIITDNQFDCNSLKDYSKMITKPTEMSKYLERNCIFQIDDKEIDLYKIVTEKDKQL